MDDKRFDELTRVVGVSIDRKRFLSILASAFGASGLVGGSGSTEAKKRGKKRKRPQGNVSAQGDPASQFCQTLCQTSGTPSFCDAQSSCTSDADCPALQPYCCQTGSCSSQGGAGVCCAAPLCTADSCAKDSDCANSPGCLCNTATGVCGETICAGGCFKDSDCPDYAGCVCNLSNTGEVQAQGNGVPPGQCGTRETCGGSCIKDSDCSFAADCVCDEATEQCVTVACPGTCDANDDCTSQGQDQCVCFLGVDTASPVTAQGAIGTCGECQTTGEPCTASTECCGQLVCDPAELGVQGLGATGTCQPKPKPGRRCKKHGQGCQRDGECCAQGVCYKGKCGEKDTHCNNNGECAAGYRCQGGPLAPSHRRCRKNGRKRRNKTHRRHG